MIRVGDGGDLIQHETESGTGGQGNVPMQTRYQEQDNEIIFSCDSHNTQRVRKTGNRLVRRFKGKYDVPVAGVGITDTGIGIS